jgi:acetylornithine deacetylase/succinyl-diaminopimelate desuccinylase-like protein
MATDRRPSGVSAWHGYLDAYRVRFLDELVELLRVPSVSSAPEHAADVERAAAWVVDRLTRAGLEHAAVMPTGGHPVVYADWLHAPGRPTVMLYGHFDVVPPGPLERWTSPPFEPAVRDGRLYARGTCDSKGNLVPAVQAVEALLRADGRLPVNLRVFAEGQEEIASPQLPAFIADHRHLLACDLVLCTDGGRCGADPPQLVVGARGACGHLVEVRGPRPGLHGANYGGAVQSPLRALVHILDSLQDAHGRVRVEGFYDDVRALTPDDRAQLAALPFDEEDYRARAGVTELVGEPGYTTLERVGARPYLIFGAVAADGGPGAIPTSASARVLMLLVPDQAPERAAELFRAHVARHTLPGVTVEVRPQSSAHPFVVPADHPGNRVASEVVRQLSGRAPYAVRLGGVLPVCAEFRRTLGAHMVFVGQTAGDENAHGPDEFIRLESIERTRTAMGLMLERLAEVAPEALRPRRQEPH